MKIAVYSGSFDPLHIGHQAIMEYLTREGEFDWVYLVVSPQNPFKDPAKALSARHRYDAAVEAVARHPELKVRVDDVELRMPPPHYTIRTLDALRAREPENDVSLVIGGDNLAGISRWRDSARLLSEYPLVVYPRKGFDCDELRAALLQDLPCDIRIIDAPLVDISSTALRAAISRGEDVSGWLM